MKLLSSQKKKFFWNIIESDFSSAESTNYLIFCATFNILSVII